MTQRVIIDLLIERFPELTHSVGGLELRGLDAQLRASWRDGEPLWPDAADLFPKPRFWYLYGAPEAAAHHNR